MPLPPGVVDPLFLYELAEKLHMTVAELCHGRGTPTSLHEISVGWPAYYRTKQLEREHLEAKTQPGRAL
jgi:hypothetical protein